MWNPNNKKCDEKFNIESGRYCQVQIFLAKHLTLCSFDLEISSNCWPILWWTRVLSDIAIIIYSRFYCKVDMKCMVSYIQWYHEMNNGKYFYEQHINKCLNLNVFRKCETAENWGNSRNSLQLHNLQGRWKRVFSIWRIIENCIISRFHCYI